MTPNHVAADSSPTALDILAPVIGAALVLLIFGTRILPPGNTGWMLSGTLGPDPVQYWLGWRFFAADEWRWPPGLSPRFGLEISSSVFYADAIPLLALAFKLLRPLFDVPQYWGLWLVACGALQGWLAWQLAALVTPHPLARLTAVVFFVLQPMLLNRMGGHFALAGQWLILWGLLLVLTPPGRWRGLGWAGLVLAASLIHSYLLPMVLALWLADAVARGAWREALPVPAAGLLGLWLAGFFALRAGHGGGEYGTMQLDLLAPFDPGYWGAFLPALPGPDHPEIGGSYLGLGALILCSFTLAAPLGRRVMPLAAVLLAMLAFAVTPSPSIGGWRPWQVTPPFAELLGALRASERYFWPLAYALMVAGLAGLTRVAGPRGAALVLVVLAGVQAVDLRPGLGRLAGFFPPTAPTLPLVLNHPAWTDPRFTRLRAVPAANQGAHWQELAVLAATTGRATDAIYLARVDAGRLAALNAATFARLAEGRPEPGTLYMLRDAAALAAARAGLRPDRDTLSQANGMWVLLPDSLPGR